MHHEFEWPKPENKGEEDNLRHIREFGCSNISVAWGGNEKEPPFTYSVGLFANYNHPELILFGLNNAGSIINEIRDHVVTGANSPTAISSTISWRMTTRSASGKYP
jgi:Domain of unknown function (DUF4262)